MAICIVSRCSRVNLNIGASCCIATHRKYTQKTRISLFTTDIRAYHRCLYVSRGGRLRWRSENICAIHASQHVAHGGSENWKGIRCFCACLLMKKLGTLLSSKKSQRHPYFCHGVANGSERKPLRADCSHGRRLCANSTPAEWVIMECIRPAAGIRVNGLHGGTFFCLLFFLY